MKKLFLPTAICTLLLFMLINVTSFAQDRQYTSGTVWTVSMVKTKANMGVEYLNSLKANWKAINDEAKAQGLILSYKILEGRAANPEDYDIILMVETKDMASMEGTEAKWDAIRKKVMGGEEAIKNVNQARVNVRDMYGSKVMREVIYK